jgi:anti-sigma B factor antagonist
MPEFRVDTRSGGGDVVLSVVGEIDLATAWELEGSLERALGAGARRLVLDLRRVRFMDASGAALLIRQNQHAAEVACSLVIVQGPPPVQRLFELTGLSERLVVVAEPPLVAA